MSSLTAMFGCEVHHLFQTWTFCDKFQGKFSNFFQPQSMITLCYETHIFLLCLCLLDKTQVCVLSSSLYHIVTRNTVHHGERCACFVANLLVV